MRVAEYVERLRSLEGIRWVHQGRSRHGVDCIGVLMLPLLEAGVLQDNVPNYPRTSHEKTLVAALQQHCEPVAWSDRREGDVLLMWWNRSTRAPQHLASLVRMEDGTDGIVHSYMDAGRVVCSHLGRWRRRVLSVWRIRELEA